MRREHELEQSVIPEPVHWFPLTSDGNDNIGSLIRVSGSPTYTSDGAYFTGVSSHTLRYNNVPLSDFKTISFDVKFSSKSGLRKMFTLFYNNTSQYGSIAGWDWGSVSPAQFLNGDSIWHSSTVVNDDWNINEWYKITIRITDSDTDVFVNKTYLTSLGTAYNRNYNHTLYIGGRETSGREFYGYIRDFKMWNVALTNEQISIL